MSLLPASLTKIGLKLKTLAWKHCFPVVSQWEFSVPMTTTTSMKSAPKPKSSLSPIPVMIHIKFDQDWPTDLGDSIISLLKI